MEENRKSHMSICMICGKVFDGIKVIPSKEHIIPEALGNEKLITYSVCQKCNNDLGSHVDSYLTDFILTKMIRKTHLEKDVDLSILEGIVTDEAGNKYHMTNKGPKIIPRVKSDDAKGTIQIQASSTDEALMIARKILQKRFGKSDREIESILSTPERFMKHETVFRENVKFSQEKLLDETTLIHIQLAAIKIAYEYAVEKLGEAYTVDKEAAVLRTYLKASKDGKRTFSEHEIKDIHERCHTTDAFTHIAEYVAKKYETLSGGHHIQYLIILSSDDADRLLCVIRILNENFLTFTVFLSSNAKLYLRDRGGFLSAVCDDGNLYEPAEQMTTYLKKVGGTREDLR